MRARGAPTGAMSVVVSCEHGGNEIPAAYARHFDSPAAREALASHRGWDPGSLEIAESFAAALDAPLVVQRVSRLLVECNRSLEHPRLFSELSLRLSDAERADVVERYWRRHRDAVREQVRSAPPEAMVVHVGMHTFTPVWRGRPRTTTMGLLYDPRRPMEAELVRRWRSELERLLAAALLPADRIRVHLNRPYRGWTDGLTTTLRSELPESRYIGIELEVSQGLVGGAVGGGSAGELVGEPGHGPVGEPVGEPVRESVGESGREPVRESVGEPGDQAARAREIGGTAAAALRWVLEGGGAGPGRGQG